VDIPGTGRPSPKIRRCEVLRKQVLNFSCGKEKEREGERHEVVLQTDARLNPL